jgi:hypothetical protein
MSSYTLSEEETSKIGDEFYASIVEDESHCSISFRASSRYSYRGTAKVASFVFSGKPQLIDISPCDGLASSKRRGTNCTEETRHCPSPLRPISTTTMPSSMSAHTLSVNLSSTKLLLPQCTNLTANARSVSILPADRFPIVDTQDVRIVSLSDAIAKTHTDIAERAWLSRMNGILRTLSKTVKAIRVKIGG